MAPQRHMGRCVVGRPFQRRLESPQIHRRIGGRSTGIHRSQASDSQRAGHVFSCVSNPTGPILVAVAASNLGRRIALASIVALYGGRVVFDRIRLGNLRILPNRLSAIKLPVALRTAADRLSDVQPCGVLDGHANAGTRDAGGRHLCHTRLGVTLERFFASPQLAILPILLTLSDTTNNLVKSFPCVKFGCRLFGSQVDL